MKVNVPSTNFNDISFGLFFQFTDNKRRLIGKISIEDLYKL